MIEWENRNFSYSGFLWIEDLIREKFSMLIPLLDTFRGDSLHSFYQLLHFLDDSSAEALINKGLTAHEALSITEA